MVFKSKRFELNKSTFRQLLFLHFDIMLSMAEQRTRKQKETVHYPFLVSWQPNEGSQARVNRELNSISYSKPKKLTASKRAEELAKEGESVRIKKDIIRSVILVSFILVVEVVVYLAWKKFFLS